MTTKINEIKRVFGPLLEVHSLAEQLELLDLRLLESNSAIKTDASVKNIASINQNINIGFHRLDNPSTCIAFQYSLSVFGTSESQEEIIRISAKYGELFRVISDETFKDNDLEKFGQLVGLNTIWPYWREFVQSITMRMNLPPLTLPIMRPGDIQFTKEQQECDLPKKRSKQTRKKTSK